MESGRRAMKKEGKKLNIVKVIVVALIIILIIASGIIFSIINQNKDKKDNNIKDITDVSTEAKEEKKKTIDEIATEFGGEIKEKIKKDTYYVVKDGKDYTIYADGEIVEGRVALWDGSAQKPAVDEAGNINIYTASELKWVADQVASGEKSFAGVTINIRKTLDFGARKNDEGVWEGTAWTPIIGFLETPKTEANANEVVNESTEVTKEYLKRFAGTFIGNGCSIRGLYVNSKERYSGLFGYQTGTITSINIKESSITGAESVGAIAGLNGGTIQNCTVTNVEIIGTEKVGGLIGTTMTSSTIEDCDIEGNNSMIIGDKYVGGIVGYVNNNANISRCANNANISGSDYVGGIAGISFYATIIKDSSNSAMKIVGEEYVGGLVGYSQSQIENSYNNSKGSIVAKNYVGGLVGANYVMGNITNCYNSSKVSTSQDNCGGIVGINNANISNCYNTGEIDAKETEGNKIGGICGQNISDSYISTSYNTGKINSKSNVGGIVGTNFGTISNSFFLNTISENVADGDYSKTEEEMKNSILESLGENYKKDSENKNSGFPILTWQ